MNNLPTGYYRKGMTARQLNVAARQHREAREREFDRSARQLLAVSAEAVRLTRAKWGGKPKLEAARAKLRLIQSKQPTTAPPAPRSRTPNLDKYRARFAAMENSLIRDGFLCRQPEYDERGRLIGHRIRRPDNVKDFGRFQPTPEHARRTRLKLLESSIARREWQAGEPIEIDVKWSPHIP